MDKKFITRIGLLIYALVNQSLMAAGHGALPFAEGDLEVLLGTGFTIVMAVINAVADNRTKAKKAKDAQAEEVTGQ